MSNPFLYFEDNLAGNERREERKGSFSSQLSLQSFNVASTQDPYSALGAIFRTASARSGPTSAANISEKKRKLDTGNQTLSDTAPFMFGETKSNKKLRSTLRVWRIIGDSYSRLECVEKMRFHRWKEPVTNSPRGSGCRVSQCVLHNECTHLIKMR
jgi:hypothetical protein